MPSLFSSAAHLVDNLAVESMQEAARQVRATIDASVAHLVACDDDVFAFVQTALALLLVAME